MLNGFNEGVTVKTDNCRKRRYRERGKTQGRQVHSRSQIPSFLLASGETMGSGNENAAAGLTLSAPYSTCSLWNLFVTGRPQNL